MPPQPSGELARLLEEVLKRRKPELLALVVTTEVRHLTHDIRVELSRLVTEELVETGLLSDSTPSPRGAKLEALVDALEPWREDA
jgi:hypothetical protein